MSLFKICRGVTFSLDLSAGSGNLETLDEGVEFAYRIEDSDSEWIPLAFYSSQTDRDDLIRVGPGELIGSNLTIRGYSVPFYFGDTHNVRLKLCGSNIIQDNASLSFRWLQTIPAAIQISNDEVAIDDVQISINSSTLQHDIVLLMDNFNNQTSIK